MKKSVELAKSIAAMRIDVQAMVDAGDAEAANAKAEELNALVAEYNKVVTAENAAKNNFISNERHGGKIMDFKTKNRIFNKLLLHKNLTAEEQEYAKTLVDTVGTGQNESVDADGGYLVPVEHYNRVVELKKQYIPLADLCWKYPAKSKSGTIPTLAGTSDKLTAFDELNALTAHKVAFSAVSYNLGLYGDLIPVSNALMKDADVNVIDVIGGVFAKKAVNTENKAILDTLKEKLDSSADVYDANAIITGADQTAINTVLNKVLDPAASKNAVIITNQSGFDFLDNLSDENGHPLLTASLADETQKKYKGRNVVVLNDADLANSGTGSTTMPFVIGDIEEAIVFATREGLEVAVSSEAGFTAYATMLRAIERFDVKWKNSAAVGFAMVTPA